MPQSSRLTQSEQHDRLRNCIPSNEKAWRPLMESNYWDRTTRSRVSRRRVLAFSGAAAAAAFLAACGGDDEGDGGNGGNEGGATPPPGDTTSLLFQPSDQTSSAKRGGTLNLGVNIGAASYEQTLNGSGSGGSLLPHVYSTLVRPKMGTPRPPSRRDRAGVRPFPRDQRRWSHRHLQTPWPQV